MSEEQEDLELQALSRQLDDAFQTTRPRSGFENELWVRMQARQPLGGRLLESLRGLIQGIRGAPAMPLAGVAALLVVVLGVGLIAYGGLGRTGGGGGATSAGVPQGAQAPAGGELYAGFGKLPSPVLQGNPRPNSALFPQQGVASGPADYAGPVQLTWTGQLTLAVSSAPVIRYQEPSTTSADQFASSVGAVLRSRPNGLLGSYLATDYTLEVRGTVQSPPATPAYFIYSSPSMPPVDAAGAGPADVASLFLAEHSLTPDWSYTAAVDTSSKLTRVVLQRQFQISGYGPAYLVDAAGTPYGMEVDIENGSHVAHVSGVLPVKTDSATYPIISSDVAIRAALGTGSPVPVPGGTPPPAVKLTQADLAYMLVPAGDHSFYEPVFVFSGTFQVGGTTYAKHVVVAAVDPAQLSR